MGFGLCRAFFVFRVENCTKSARYSPDGFIVIGCFFIYTFGMEKLINTLEKLGTCPETIEEIKSADDDKAKEMALLIIAMFDDRHEYVD